MAFSRHQGIPPSISSGISVRDIAGVADVIASRVGISAEKGDPLGQMKLSSRAKAQAVQRDATALLTACGLALRSFD